MKKLLLVTILLLLAVAHAEPKAGQKNYFPNCKALNKVYPNGVPKKHPAYRSALDRNNNGWACEPKPR
jgi:micrococcal nuclease